MAASPNELAYFHGPWRADERRTLFQAIQHFEAHWESALPERRLGETWVLVKQPFVNNAFLYSVHRAGWMHAEGGHTADELVRKLGTRFDQRPHITAGA